MLMSVGCQTTVIARDVEEWGQKTFSPTVLMTESFKAIQESDVVLIETSEKGVGIGIEAGFAAALSKPIYVICKASNKVSDTLKGIAKEVKYYQDPEELVYLFQQLCQN